MDLWTCIILGSGIIFSWMITGWYEWKPPLAMVRKISRLREKMAEKEFVEVWTMNMEACEFVHDDIEKEVYIIRKARNPHAVRILINLDAQTGSDQLAEIERAKNKRRLEKRFPGINVQFSAGGQEKSHAFSLADQ